ncbi:uncharacterized protein N7511_002265 [Penicillium nucicola]|uniref:uncharacterized protein n=1 Tax=Penicillium nucicola TaxID=1850975 RepID=UPI0025452136|nr:uncharacterized protein N7511_002265 [Penicillium nucicola]KAJ5770214.1 hypothetical protein N7511_002265 [Penicillium nucicola]
MSVDKIKVSGDPRIEYKTAVLNGRNYSYILSQPKTGQYKATVFLIHGFPDISMGWRYQVPMLVNMGLRVVAPDCLGYGRTDAPADPEPYGHKSCAADIKALATHLGETKIILGGHDWHVSPFFLSQPIHLIFYTTANTCNRGAALAYRIALWHPDLVSHLFTVCVPYARPMEQEVQLEDLVRTAAPHFAYQIQFASGEVEKVVKSDDDIRQFLLALYGGRNERGDVGFDAHHGVLVDRLGGLKRSKLLSEDEIEFYVREFGRNGVQGPLNWYRTRQVNYQDELAILDRKIEVPTLFIQALRDQALPAHLGKSMVKHIPSLTVKQVNTSHWALWEKPQEVNDIIEGWLKEKAFTEARSEKL